MSAVFFIALPLLCPGTLDGSIGEDRSAPGPMLELSARIEPQPVRLGERFELVIEVRRRRGELLRLPDPLPASDDLELLGLGQASQRDLDDGVIETLRIAYAAFGLDDVRTPEIAIAKGDETLQVAPLPVEVKQQISAQSPGSPPPQPATASAPIDVQRFDPRPLIAGAGLLVLLLLLAIAWWWRRRPGREAGTIKPSPPRPAHEVALERLDKLEKAGWVHKGQLQRFVDEATEILRWYLGQRYRLSALDQTSTELLSSLQGVLDAGLDLRLLDELLQGADLVKFARAGTTAQVCADWLRKIRGVILQTRESTQTGGAR